MLDELFVRHAGAAANQDVDLAEAVVGEEEMEERAAHEARRAEERCRSFGAGPP
ncbi:hypothetical protein [Polyangium mundeleinium]|uniref:Uncharacterized protein n=1 Tax=Polyangium mundeleinium TaxID=2995306 RepID=A0ABT5EYS2_9BACT|nr:hypothetical protein [Polyangium mundeleinium]MDC0746422.1 hypothetical protein [Polyangium mundeleinium]